MSKPRRNPTDNETALLLSEVENLCPFCSRTLMYEKNGQKKKRYEAAHIYPLNPTPKEIELLKGVELLHADVNHLNNFIALCRTCHKQFDHPRTVEEYGKLFKLKKELIARAVTREQYHDYQIELEIKQVIHTLVNEFSESTGTPLSMNALKIDEKTDDTLNGLTKRRIVNNVTDYYVYIKGQFQLLDLQEGNSFELISMQVKTFYLKIRKSEHSQQVIYEQLTEWLYKKTENSSWEACSIIIAFFIQNCEVF